VETKLKNRNSHEEMKKRGVLQTHTCLGAEEVEPTKRRKLKMFQEG
jgi:hypothetical protein